MASTNNIMTDADKEKIVHLRTVKGLSYKAIAEDVGVSEKTVSWYCLINCVERFDGRKGYTRTGDIKDYYRNGKLIRAFTPDEDQILLKLAIAGTSNRAIGKKLGRAHNTIQGRLATIARRQERAAQ